MRSLLASIATGPLAWLLAGAQVAATTTLLLTKVPMANVAMSRERVVDEGKFWSIVVSPFVHTDFFILVFNVVLTVTCSNLESRLGHFEFARSVLCLVVVPAIIHLVVMGWLSGLPIDGLRPYFRSHSSSGFTPVICGWLATVSARAPTSGSILSMERLPLLIAPAGVLVLSQIMSPNTSLLSNSIGILTG